MRIEVRPTNVQLSSAERAHIESRLGFALGRLASRIRRVEVRLRDVNGPRGGLDHHCRIAARLAPRGSVEVEATDLDPRAAVDLAARRIERRLKREIDRRRTLRRTAPASGREEGGMVP